MEVHQPILHIEARVKTNNDGIIVRTDLIRDELTNWIADKFVVLSLGQKIVSFGNNAHAHALDSMLVCDCSGDTAQSGTYQLHQVKLDVQAYQLHTQPEPEDPQTLDGSTGIGVELTRARIMALPNMDLNGLWESLHFDQPIQSTLLTAISRMLSFSVCKLDRWTITWNKLVLLWGPPGTGKTSLCRGLAQKLAIRLGKDYPQSKLFEINAHALGSKFFSEGAKLVDQMFERIDVLLEEEDETLVCVFIDEIETLAARRDRALSNNEPFDAIRAVNALLTGLDKVKAHSNVVVVCTSNLLTALDQAFLDRVDIKQYVPNLSSRSIYRIYKDCLEEMSRNQIIDGTAFDVKLIDPNDPHTTLSYVEKPAKQLSLPTYDETVINYIMFSEAVPTLLAEAVSESLGLSGRTIRRLPILSLVMYGGAGRGSDIRRAIQALRNGIAAEWQTSQLEQADCNQVSEANGAWARVQEPLKVVSQAMEMQEGR
ncbi:putative pachytene checkpoint component Pch2 [Aspergillus homomorphus CBS 101889]|uniref:Putative pachytene checkpoint component Pch2 n=1 Tax=Aspergillus homomorphus (strain CBS 101889) TaxID=1450537 RepID=A0A395I0I4_ASPHC|nr:putative pachytene checkpoint component Pch2 [Aspergillus homomorphus CBS 101889]RAL12044.1 putative pachytene checkpoint component Pch2 [Aspergillus homomorphus CBS 101889]